MIFLSPMVASLHLSLKSSFSALSARFLRPLGTKSGVEVTPQLRRPRALCTVRSMALRAAVLLRACAQTTFLGNSFLPLERRQCVEACWRRGGVQHTLSVAPPPSSMKGGGRGPSNIILSLRQPPNHRTSPRPPQIIWKGVSCRRIMCERNYGPPCRLQNMHKLTPCTLPKNIKHT